MGNQCCLQRGHSFERSRPRLVQLSFPGTDVLETELDAAISTFHGALKGLKFAMPKPALPLRTKSEIRALCSTSWPVQTLLLHYVHGTPEDLESPERPQLSDEDERELTEVVQTLSDCLVAIVTLVGDMLRMRAMTAEYDQYAVYGEYVTFGYGGGYINDYGQSLANRRKATQELSNRIRNAQEAIREETAHLREILAKYGIKDSNPSDFICLATPAVPAKSDENLPEASRSEISESEESNPQPGIVARCIKSIATAARNRFLPAGSQEESASESESDTDQSRAVREERKRYQQLKHRYSASKTFRDQKKQTDYHKEAEQNFADLRAKLGEERRNHPSASTGTDQILLDSKIETRVILHLRMQSQQKSGCSIEVGEENLNS
ncbi:hypothetical protein PG991_015661 [Apiospora marii]|uniref:BZIP domain-containing protein n=1 Tax=Apiospora marii TaxID=335849 RepID=A0ABR1R2B7_9PEZI